MQGRHLGLDGRQRARRRLEATLDQLAAQLLVQGGDAVVVEAGRHRAEHGQVLEGDPGMLTVAGQLAAHVAQGVGAAPALELVDGDGVGEVEHVDLLELRGRPELRGHHVQRHVHQRGQGGVALADAGRLDDHEVGSRRPAGVDDVGQGGRHLRRRPPGGQGAEVDPIGVDGVHADPVAEEGAPALGPGRVDGDDGDPELVLLVEAEAPHQLVGQRRLARAAGAGDPEGRDGPAPGRGPDQVEAVVAEGAVLDGGDDAGQDPLVAGEELLPVVAGRGKDGVALGDHGVDHPLEAEGLPVLGREDAGHPVGLEGGDLLGDDHPAAAPVDPDVTASLLPEAVDEVPEVLVVAALVGADGDAVDVLLDGGGDDLVHRAVVTEVDDLGALALQQPAHDVDGGVVAVEETGGRHETDGASRPVQRCSLYRRRAGGAGSRRRSPPPIY